MFRSCVFWNYHSNFDKNINSSPGYIISVCSSKKIRWMTGFAFLVGLAGSTITVLCSGGKSRTDKIKIEVYGYRKTGNSIKISFNFNHLILYRISVWLVSLVFFFFLKKSISRRHDVSFTFIATIDHRNNGGMSNQKFTAIKIIRITCKFAPKNWHKCIFKG